MVGLEFTIFVSHSFFYRLVTYRFFNQSSADYVRPSLRSYKTRPSNDVEWPTHRETCLVRILLRRTFLLDFWSNTKATPCLRWPLRSYHPRSFVVELRFYARRVGRVKLSAVDTLVLPGTILCVALWACTICTSALPYSDI